MRIIRTLQSGISLIEVVVAVAIILLVVSSSYGVNVFYVKAVLANHNKVRAAFLAEEGIEAVKLIRDQSWNAIAALTPGATNYLYWNGSMWQVATINTFVDSTFERKFVLENVGRDSNSDIVSSGGTNDANTKKLIVTVSWRDGTATTSKAVSTYITNFVQ